MLLSLRSSEHRWTILMNVWRLAFSITEQEGNVPWSHFQHPISILPLGVNFLESDASLEYQNNLRSRISVGQLPMRIVVVIEGIDTSLDDDHKSQVLEHFWTPETEWTGKYLFCCCKGDGGSQVLASGLQAVTWLDGEIRLKTWEMYRW